MANWLKTKGEIIARITHLKSLNQEDPAIQKELDFLHALFSLRLKKDHPSRSYYKYLLHTALGWSDIYA